MTGKTAKLGSWRFFHCERKEVSTGVFMSMGYNEGKLNIKKATFGAGCFWGVEEAFRKVPGVIETVVGYMGGSLENPNYEDVCSGKSGHIEVVQLKYDFLKVSYDKLLKTFWKIHDPTSLDKQGADTGKQYRSVIFYHNLSQKSVAVKSKEKLEKSGKYKNRIVTEIIPATKFWRAEEYHQRYLEKQGMAACHI